MGTPELITETSTVSLHKSNQYTPIHLSGPVHTLEIDAYFGPYKLILTGHTTTPDLPLTLGKSNKDGKMDLHSSTNKHTPFPDHMTIPFPCDVINFSDLKGSLYIKWRHPHKGWNRSVCAIVRRYNILQNEDGTTAPKYSTI